ncbi:MAG: hypothetical protein DDT33_00603 [Firmicutes bacterium]|nr:hypothetical protein [Bacillota bacterium]
MNIEKIKAELLKPARYNPRKDLKPGDKEYQKLRRSIEEFGYVEPVIFNRRTDNVVGGHQRLKVLLALGHTEIDCVVVELDLEREKALNIALNKIQGEWEEDKLVLLISDLQAADFDVSLLGFDDAELNQLLGGLEDVKDDDFDVDGELQKPAITKLGDLWLLGKHRLVCGDSTTSELYEQLMDGKKANLIVTDLPYNVK